MGSCGGTGTVEDALQHAAYTAILASKVHFDYPGGITILPKRRKSKAAQIAKAFMDAREGCKGMDWDAAMDLHNNAIGAQEFKKRVRTHCTRSVGLPFGLRRRRHCILSKEVSPSSTELFDAFLSMVAQARYFEVSGSEPFDSSWEN